MARIPATDEGPVDAGSGGLRGAVAMRGDGDYFSGRGTKNIKWKSKSALRMQQARDERIKHGARESLQGEVGEAEVGRKGAAGDGRDSFSRRLPAENPIFDDQVRQSRGWGAARADGGGPGDLRIGSERGEVVREDSASEDADGEIGDQSGREGFAHWQF